MNNKVFLDTQKGDEVELLAFVGSGHDVFAMVLTKRGFIDTRSPYLLKYLRGPNALDLDVYPKEVKIGGK